MVGWDGVGLGVGVLVGGWVKVGKRRVGGNQWHVLRQALIWGCGSFFSCMIGNTGNVVVC